MVSKLTCGCEWYHSRNPWSVARSCTRFFEQLFHGDDFNCWCRLFLMWLLVPRAIWGGNLAEQKENFKFDANTVTLFLLKIFKCEEITSTLVCQKRGRNTSQFILLIDNIVPCTLSHFIIASTSSERPWQSLRSSSKSTWFCVAVSRSSLNHVKQSWFVKNSNIYTNLLDPEFTKVSFLICDIIFSLGAKL